MRLSHSSGRDGAGLTAMWIAFFNFLSMFFAPLFGSIPTLSTGPALIMVGVFMAEGLGTIDWSPRAARWALERGHPRQLSALSL